MDISRIIEIIYSRIMDEKLVIYPLGNNGLMIKSMLNNVLHYKEHAVIDRTLSMYSDEVFSLDELGSIPYMKECIYLITSDKYPFGQWLVENGVSSDRIINPFISIESLLTDCFIGICNEGYNIIHDYSAFCFENGQISRTFFSTIENKYYYFYDKVFMINNSEYNIPSFYSFYHQIIAPEVTIAVIKQDTHQDIVDKTIKHLVQERGDVVLISCKEIGGICVPTLVSYRFSYLYVYRWKGADDGIG